MCVLLEYKLECLFFFKEIFYVFSLCMIKDVNRYDICICIYIYWYSEIRFIFIFEMNLVNIVRYNRLGLFLVF